MSLPKRDFSGLPKSALCQIFSYLMDDKEFLDYLFLNKKIYSTIEGIIGDIPVYMDVSYEDHEIVSNSRKLVFGKGNEATEKNINYIKQVKEVTFLPNCKSVRDILLSNKFDVEPIQSMAISYPGVHFSPYEILYNLGLTNLIKLDLYNLNKYYKKDKESNTTVFTKENSIESKIPWDEPVTTKCIEDLLMHCFNYTPLKYLKLNHFLLDNSITLYNSLYLTKLVVEVTGTEVNFDILNLFMPNLAELEISYLTNPLSKNITGLLKPHNFPKLFKLKLRSHFIMSRSIQDYYMKNVSLFAPLEPFDWYTVKYLSIDTFSLASFNSISSNFINVETLELILDDNDFKPSSLLSMEKASENLKTLIIEGTKLSLFNLCKPLECFANIYMLTLRLQDFEFNEMKYLKYFKNLKELTLILRPNKDSTFQPKYWQLDEIIQPKYIQQFEKLYGTKVHIPHYEPLEKTNDEKLSYPFDGSNIFKSLLVLKVNLPKRMHSVITWIVDHSRNLKTILYEGQLGEHTEKFLTSKYSHINVYRV